MWGEGGEKILAPSGRARYVALSDADLRGAQGASFTEPKTERQLGQGASFGPGLRMRRIDPGARLLDD